MRFVLDTTELSALMKGNVNAIEHLTAARRTDVLVPQPVIAEISYGLSRLPRSRRQRTLQDRFDVLARQLLRTVWSDDVSRLFGQTKALLEKRGQRLDDFDIAIAAHALAEGATLVSANLEHMARVPRLTVERWSG